MNTFTFFCFYWEKKEKSREERKIFVTQKELLLRGEPSKFHFFLEHTVSKVLANSTFSTLIYTAFFFINSSIVTHLGNWTQSVIIDNVSSNTNKIKWVICGWVLEAASNDDTEEVKTLLENGADIHARNEK